MQQDFLIIDSYSKLQDSYKSFIDIYAEYSLFRLKTNNNYKPVFVLEQLKQTGETFENLVRKFTNSIEQLEPFDGFFEYFETKCKEYFKYFVLQIDGRSAAQASIEKYNNEIVILHRVYVKPNYRGNNYGTILLEKIAQTAKTDGFKMIYLDTIPVLTSAIRMYKKFGFRQRDYFPLPEITVEMAKTLQSIFMEYDLQE